MGGGGGGGVDIGVVVGVVVVVVVVTVLTWGQWHRRWEEDKGDRGERVFLGQRRMTHSVFFFFKSVGGEEAERVRWAQTKVFAGRERKGEPSKHDV